MDINDLHRQIVGNELSDDEKLLLQALTDPVTWIETTLRDPEDPLKLFKFKGRDYQKELLRFQPKYISVNGKNTYINRIKVYRLGRRLGKTVLLAAEALWKATTNNGYRILHIAPYESQCSIFWGMLERLMSDSQIRPVRFVKKPFQCQFSNGSTIHSHTANVRATRKGSTIRGAEADLILLDEMDYGSDEVIMEVIMPIFFGNDKSCVIAASTPSGRRGLFYEWCSKGLDIGIRQFHYPASISPKWTEEAEKMARASMTREQYIHEIEAEFGESLEGVFRHKDLDRAMKKYEYKELKYNKENVYIMGVDWNEKFGVCIVILERDKVGHYRIFKHEIVSKQEFTQLEGLSRIINIHERECRCHHIYVDHGFGTTQIELLKKYGLDHKASNMSSVLKSIDYGGTIEIRDPITGEKLKKPAKAFLVNNAQMLIEDSNGIIDIPEVEDEDYGIIGQARNFRVSKFSNTGVPVFDGKFKGEDNDHSLNAMMLAMVGFTMEYSDFNQYQTTSKIASVPNFGRPKEIGRTTRIESENVDKFRTLMKSIMPNYRIVKTQFNEDIVERKLPDNPFLRKARKKLGSGGRSSF